MPRPCPYSRKNRSRSGTQTRARRAAHRSSVKWSARRSCPLTRGSRRWPPFHEAQRISDRPAAKSSRVSGAERRAAGASRRALDRPGHELREEGEKTRKSLRSGPRHLPPPIDVDRVTHRLERVERDAHRQHDMEQRVRRLDPKRSQQMRHTLDEEVAVFEKAKDAEIGANTHRHEHPPPRLDTRVFHPLENVAAGESGWKKRVSRRGGGCRDDEYLRQYRRPCSIPRLSSSMVAHLLASFGVHAPHTLLHVVLPVGISSHIPGDELHDRRISAAGWRGRSLKDFLVYITFFPLEMAGPIERAASTMPQLCAPRHVTREDFAEGLSVILWGLVKKVVIADNCRGHRERGSSAAWAAEPGDECCSARYAFAWQIYGDFSGYSSIARGSAQLIGIPLMVNFRPALSLRVCRSSGGAGTSACQHLAARLPLHPARRQSRGADGPMRT